MASNSAAAQSVEVTASDEGRPVQGSAIALSCPQCLAALTASESGLDCPKCDVHYPVENGIADLRRGRKDYYFNPVRRGPMAQIIAEASAGKWARAIRHFMQEVRFNPDWMDNLVADGRYAWKLFLELPPGAKVLDIGCGLGNLTRNVAPQVGEVCALDLTWERLQFARARFANFNRDDRISLVAGGDGAHLPFADQTFDCVLISGVLEWVADDSSLWSSANGKLDKIGAMLRAHFGETNPRRVQLRFLQEVRRVLKTSGQLFVGIENRLGHHYFTGRPDHHSGLMYGSLLPRGVATVYSIARARAPYRTYTYAFPGYRRLMREAGFDECRFLGLTPGYSHLSEIIPFSPEWRGWSRRSVQDSRSRMRTSKLFVPAYGIVASSAAQSRAQPNLIERIVRDAEQKAGAARGSLILSDLRVTEEEVAVASGQLGARDVILRIALNPTATGWEQANHDTLCRIGHSHPGLRDRVPAPLAAGNVQKTFYALQAKPIGIPLGSGDVERAALLAADWLRDMNPAPVQGAPAVEVIDAKQALDAPLKAIAAALDDASVVSTVREALVALLAEARMKRGLVHGNLLPGNIHVRDGAITTVVDWKWSCEAGWPIVDCLRFVDGWLDILSSGLRGAQRLSRLADLGALPAPLRAFVQEYYRELGLDPAWHTGFVCLYWTSLTGRTIEQLALDAQALERDVHPALQWIAQHACFRTGRR